MQVSKDQLAAYLLGSLNCSGVIYHENDIIRALSVYRRALGKGWYHLPFFLVVDLLLLLEQGFEVRFRSDTIPTDEQQKRKLVMRYERECLGRVLQSSEILAAAEVATTSEPPGPVTEQLLFQLLRSLAEFYPADVQLNPGLIREYRLPSDWHSGEFDDYSFEASVETFLGKLNAGINWGQLLYEEDFFELAHFSALNSDHLRVGCRQILEVSRLLRDSEPLQLDLSAHEEGADTAYLDETHYPTGGLSGLTNRGSFENLLTSELVYLDEGTEDISLFELRYAESELLYYLRDSGNLRRKRRTIHFLIDCGDVFEDKLPGYQWQYSVLIQGIALRLLHDLFEVFEMDALRFHFHYQLSESTNQEDREFYQAEAGVMETVLADYVKHGWVQFETNDDVKLDSIIDPKRKSYLVVLAGPTTSSNWIEQLAIADKNELAINTALIQVHTEEISEGMISLPSSGLGLEGLKVRKNMLLENLLS